MSSNQLDGLPDCIATMQSLKFLYANGNAISVVPPDLCLLPRLTDLNLANNQVTEVPTAWVAAWGDVKDGKIATKTVTVTLLGNPCV